jgi:carbonic anhydrase
VVSGSAYHFNYPEAMAMDRDDLFVANNAGSGGGSVTELNASTGALVRVVSGSVYKFNHPCAMAVAGGDLFVANVAGNSVTEVDASTRALVRVI